MGSGSDTGNHLGSAGVHFSKAAERVGIVENAAIVDRSPVEWSLILAQPLGLSELIGPLEAPPGDEPVGVVLNRP